jgi:hypothetical protein
MGTRAGLDAVEKRISCPFRSLVTVQVKKSIIINIIIMFMLYDSQDRQHGVRRGGADVRPWRIIASYIFFTLISI